MKFCLAQLNIARFRQPQDHPDNKDFIDNLDKVNALAEQHDGFIWRLKGDGNDAISLQVFDDPNIITNMSLWNDMNSLSAFVYRNKDHRAIMRRREEWFENMEFYLVLWWVVEGHIPTIEEAKERLELFTENGASQQAFTFKTPFPPPNET